MHFLLLSPWETMKCKTCVFSHNKVIVTCPSFPCLWFNFDFSRSTQVAICDLTSILEIHTGSIMHISPTSPIQKREVFSTKTVYWSSSVLKATSQIFTYAWYRERFSFDGIYSVGVLFVAYFIYVMGDAEQSRRQPNRTNYDPHCLQRHFGHAIFLTSHDLGVFCNLDMCHVAERRQCELPLLPVWGLLKLLHQGGWWTLSAGLLVAQCTNPRKTIWQRLTAEGPYPCYRLQR